MANERTICCCGASSWTKVIAWFQIVGNIILLIVYAFGLAGLTTVNPDQLDIPNKDSMIAAVAIALVIAVLGFIMGIILLKGTNQKRIGFLRAWLIYAGAAILTSIVSLIINIISYSDYSIGSTVGSGIVGIAINAFCFAVVFIHIKEIREGVFAV
ncbi:uncharacterized protein LOC119068262 [Bradysia coprophila]|uniref:uncharacterized protein LOC119068262 n=1 Tax=Bradysia coprophila TaxID=38358 RepID=UPI00187DCB7D|nr:uncharacterized protein LOC119068262 [Bradysia coprophila]